MGGVLTYHKTTSQYNKIVERLAEYKREAHRWAKAEVWIKVQREIDNLYNGAAHNETTIRGRIDKKEAGCESTYKESDAR